jgi:hypothetical protein
MKPSPIQLLQLMFKRVSVELDAKHLPPEIPNPLHAAFTFDGVSIQTEVGIGVAEHDPERGQVFFLELRVAVDNKPIPETTDQKFAPYAIDVAAEGVVLIPKGAERLGPPEDLAAGNGASLLWSAVREQVLAITSRMRAGPAMLPTVHFHDLKRGATKTTAIAPETAKTLSAAKKAARPKPTLPVQG